MQLILAHCCRLCQVRVLTSLIHTLYLRTWKDYHNFCDICVILQLSANISLQKIGIFHMLSTWPFGLCLVCPSSGHYTFHSPLTSSASLFHVGLTSRLWLSCTWLVPAGLQIGLPHHHKFLDTVPSINKCFQSSLIPDQDFWITWYSSRQATWFSDTIRYLAKTHKMFAHLQPSTWLHFTRTRSNCIKSPVCVKDNFCIYQIWNRLDGKCKVNIAVWHIKCMSVHKVLWYLYTYLYTYSCRNEDVLVSMHTVHSSAFTWFLQADTTSYSRTSYTQGPQLARHCIYLAFPTQGPTTSMTLYLSCISHPGVHY